MIAFGSCPETSQNEFNSPSAWHREASWPNVGRSVNKVSPLVSTPVIILNGRPLLAMMNGLKEIPCGKLKLPPITKLCRISNDVRPYSPVRSYEYAGKLPPPSVSPREKPRL